MTDTESFRPVCSPDDAADLSLTKAELRGDGPLRSVAHCRQVSDGRHLFGRHFSDGASTEIARARYTSFPTSVDHVVAMSAEKQVCDVHAGRVIAAMTNAHALRDGPIGQLPRQPMGQDAPFCCTDLEGAVAVVKPARRPLHAPRRRESRFLPESFFQRSPGALFDTESLP